jgi:hypothetical protein
LFLHVWNFHVIVHRGSSNAPFAPSRNAKSFVHDTKTRRQCSYCWSDIGMIWIIVLYVLPAHAQSSLQRYKEKFVTTVYYKSLDSVNN